MIRRSAMIAILALSACSGQEDTDTRQGHVGGAKAAAPVHDMAAMRDTVAPHAPSPAVAPADSGHSAMHGMDHRPSASTSAAGPGADHSGMRMGSGTSAGSPMDHSRMTPTGRAKGHDMTAMDHSRMSAARSSPEHAGHSPAGTTRTAPPAASTEHAGHTTGQHIRAITPDTADSGAEKLRALVAQLVEDPVVRSRIEADPALRRAWEDEGVRRSVLGAP